MNMHHTERDACEARAARVRAEVRQFQRESVTPVGDYLVIADGNATWLADAAEFSDAVDSVIGDVLTGELAPHAHDLAVNRHHGIEWYTAVCERCETLFGRGCCARYDSIAELCVELDDDAWIGKTGRYGRRIPDDFADETSLRIAQLLGEVEQWLEWEIPEWMAAAQAAEWSGIPEIVADARLVWGPMWRDAFLLCEECGAAYLDVVVQCVSDEESHRCDCARERGE